MGKLPFYVSLYFCGVFLFVCRLLSLFHSYILCFLQVFHGMATNATALTHTTARATTWLQVGGWHQFITPPQDCYSHIYMNVFDHPGNAHFKSTFPCRENQSVSFSHQPAWGEDSTQETPSSWDLAGCVGSKVRPTHHCIMC